MVYIGGHPDSSVKPGETVQHRGTLLDKQVEWIGKPDHHMRAYLKVSEHDFVLVHAEGGSQAFVHELRSVAETLKRAK